jgi:ComF family protein
MNLIADLCNILLPRRCVVCRQTLEPAEQYLCTSCSIRLPRYPLKSIEDNEPLRKVWNFAPIQYGATLLYYRHQSDFHNIIIKIKYKGGEQLGIRMGEWAATEAARFGLVEKVDVIVPVPSDSNRRKRRGYNQAELIARGMGRNMHLPVMSFLVKRETATSQTRLDRAARRENTTGKYQACIPETWRGKRILLVDDVLTTGATIGNCAQALLSADPDAVISIFTLAYDG